MEEPQEKQIVVHYKTRKELKELDKRVCGNFDYLYSVGTEKNHCVILYWGKTNLGDDEKERWIKRGHCNRSHYENNEQQFGKIVSAKDFINNNINQKTIMNKVTAMLKRLLDEDAQTLYKVGYINGDMELTDKGRRALDVVVFDEYKKQLIELAVEEIAESEDE